MLFEGAVVHLIKLVTFSADFIPSSTVEWTHSSSAPGTLHPNENPGRTICENDDGLWQVCQEGNLTVFAAPLKHRITCFGFVILQQQRPGKLDPTLLKQKGIPPGPLYAKIKNGESITAPDGNLVMPSDVLGPPRPGRKVVILGDTCDSSRIEEVASDADVVVHEATLEDELKETCIDHGHSTPGTLYRSLIILLNNQSFKLILMATFYCPFFYNPGF